MSAPKAFEQWLKTEDHLIIEHRPGCREEHSQAPLNECACDCYQYACFAAGYYSAKGHANKRRK